MKISLKTNFPEVQAKLAKLGDNIGTVVSVRSVNRTIAQARTDMSREIRGEFNLSAAKVKEKLEITKATFKGGRFNVQATLLSYDKLGKERSINLINFTARQTAAGVSVKIKRASGRKTVAGAFIGNKGRTVFKRKGKQRLPIVPVQTIDVPQMFNTKRINAAVVRAIERKFPVIFERELAYALSQFKGRA